MTTPVKDWGRWSTYRSMHYSGIADDELYPCAVCGRPHPFRPGLVSEPNVRCDGCWEVEHRLADYLKDGGEKALVFVTKCVIDYAEIPEGPKT